MCFLYSGGVDDLGWTFTFNQGRLRAHAELERRYPSVRFESVAEQQFFFRSAASKDAAIAGLIASGCNIFFTNDATLMNGREANITRDFPNVTIVANNAEPPPSELPTQTRNLAFSRLDPGSAYWLKGVVAASEARTCVGMLSAWSTRGNPTSATNGFIQGVRSVNATLPIHVVTMNSWFWPDGETDAAKLLMDELGCEVIARYSNPRAVDIEISTRQLRGFRSMGPHSNLQEYVGDSVLLASYLNWERLIVQVVEDIFATGGLIVAKAPYVNSLYTGVLSLSDISPLASATTRTRLQAATAVVGPRSSIYCAPLTLKRGGAMPLPAGSVGGCYPPGHYLIEYITMPGVSFHGEPFAFREQCGAGTFATYQTAPNISLRCTPCARGT